MAAERVQRRLAAVLAADVVGYSRLMGADEAGTLAQLKVMRKEILDPKIAEYGGRIVKTTGDGVLVEFPSAVDAVQHAADVQRAMARRGADVPADRRIELRIGINVGDVIIEGDDIFGDGVNVAARMEALAEPGGVCISGMAFESVRNKLDVEFEDLGDKEVKNIAAPVRVYRISFEPDAAGGRAQPEPTAESVLDRPAVAVLPFANMSGDPEQEFFADGLTEDIITALSYSRSFPVIARNSTFTYKGQSVKVQQVAAELGARYVVEGSVRKGGERVRITVQVIDAATGHHVWAERFDRNLDDFFDLQEEIAHRVAATIEPELAKAEHKRSFGKAPSSMDAWECYHRGLTLLENLSKDSHSEARALFVRAIELDPGFGQAHAGVALCYHRDIYMNVADDPELWRAECLKAAQQAVALDDRDAFAHSMLGFAYMWDGKTKLAIVQCEKAIEVNPSSAWGYGVLAFALFCSGQNAESIETYEKALGLNPADPWNYIRTTHLAEAHMNAGHYEQAVDWAERSIGRASHHLHAHLVLAASLGYLDRQDEARAALDECGRIRPGFSGSLTELGSYRTEEVFARLRDGLRKAGLPD